MAKIVAIDYGGKRCGIAVTDPLQIIASGLTTVDTSKLMEFIYNFIKREGLDTLVIGQPMRLNNAPSAIETEILKFIEKLKLKLPEVTIVRIDERFTSKLAMDALIRGGAKKKDRKNKKLIDQVSATMILQSYLEQKGA
ncbi:MAG: Holliday junction resolvase RuvX [Verrucomicrobia bacterium]|nr:Holliday junction resolvase RuvX [Verrucomicrobiota bacterium]